jgi:hypothetical protein
MIIGGMAHKPRTLNIFRTGRHTATNGAGLEFSKGDLAATAAAYDPALSEAPIVVGHPATDGPAYGWVKSLAFADGGLEAEPDQVDPAFAEMVSAGRFKKISASFYPPESPRNPAPGVYYLRHVGFLGAQPPAVKGLRAPAFAEDDEALTFEFGEYDDVFNASLWRSLREWLIGKFGQEEADKVVPGYQVATLEQGAQDELREAQAETGAIASPGFSEHPHQETVVTPEQKAALEAENAQLKTQLAEIKQAGIHAGHAAFAEKLVAAGQMLPAQSAVAVATLDHLAALETPVEFGEGDDKAPLLDAFKSFLQDMPKLVEFAEQATNQRAATDGDASVDFAAPAGYGVDGDSLAVHKRALAYQAQHKTDYMTAVQAVSR